MQPSLRVYYKNTHIKHYHKERRALRTETTINNTYDFRVGRLLKNLPRLRHIGFGANRRVLEVEKVSHNSLLGAEAFERMKSRSRSKASMPAPCALAIRASKRS